MLFKKEEKPSIADGKPNLLDYEIPTTLLIGKSFMAAIKINELCFCNACLSKSRVTLLSYSKQ